MKTKKLYRDFVISLFVFIAQVSAQNLGTAFTYQGELASAGAPVTGECDFEFTLWTTDGTGCPPMGGSQVGSAELRTLTLADGRFTVGDLDFGSGSFDGQPRWLEIAVCCPSLPLCTLETLCPRQKLNPTPYAVLSDQTRGVTVGANGNVGIGTTSLTERLNVDGVIRSLSGGIRFPDGSLQQTASVGDITAVGAGSGLTGGGSTGAVTLAIASSGVTSAHIQDGGIGSIDIADGTIAAVDYATGSVGTSAIQDSAVSSAKIADFTISASDLAIDSVGDAAIRTNAVTTFEIADGSVGAVDLATNSVGSDEIAPGAVGFSEIAQNAVQSFHIMNGSVTSADLADAEYLVPRFAIMMWSGSIESIPTGWQLCDGTSGTPDLRDRFILSVAAAEQPGDTGGSHSVTLTAAQMPSHTHSISSVLSTGTSKGDGDGDPRFSDSGSTKVSTSTGGNQPFDNRPKYYKLAFIMKL